jgi:hypothetical protein
MFFIFLQLNTSHLLDETSVSKVVCFYNRFKTVDLLFSSKKSWSHMLSKTLFKQCSIRIKSGIEVRVVIMATKFDSLLTDDKYQITKSESE